MNYTGWSQSVQTALIIRSCAWESIMWACSTGWSLPHLPTWGAALWKGAWGTSWIWVYNVPLQQIKPLRCWVASTRVAPGEIKKSLSYYTQHFPDNNWNGVLTFGSCNTYQMWTGWSGSREAHKDDPRTRKPEVWKWLRELGNFGKSMLR